MEHNPKPILKKKYLVNKFIFGRGAQFYEKNINLLTKTVPAHWEGPGLRPSPCPLGGAWPMGPCAHMGPLWIQYGSI